MPIYNTRWFDRWARKQSLPAASLWKKLADHLLSMTADALDKAQRAGEIVEVNCDA